MLQAQSKKGHPRTSFRITENPRPVCGWRGSGGGVNLAWTSKDRPDLNTGKPWSEMDLFDLGNCVRLRQPVEKIATFLCRSRREVREKIAELEQTGELAKQVAKPLARARSNQYDNFGYVDPRPRRAYRVSRSQITAATVASQKTWPPAPPSVQGGRSLCVLGAEIGRKATDICQA